MQHRMYAIYDTKAEAWLPPFMSPNDPVCLRTIGNMVQNSEHPFGQNPEDYSLFYIGEWNDANCKYDVEDSPRHLCNLVELFRAGVRERDAS